MRSATLFVLLGAVIAANGCGSSSGGGGTAGTSGGGGSSASGGSGGTSGGGGGAGGALATCGNSSDQGSGDTCNTAAATGPCVTQQLSTATAPTPAGGTIVAGTYNLTSLTLFNPPEGGSQSTDRRETLVVSAVTAGSLTLDQVHVSGSSTQRSHGTVIIAGTTLTFTPTCPPPGDGGDSGGSAGFTASTTMFTLIEAHGGGSSQVSVFTKAS
jgi:hypothetical protein